MWHPHTGSDVLRIPVIQLLWTHDNIVKQTTKFWIPYNICFGLKKKKEDAKITWQSVGKLMWLRPNWSKPRPRKFQAEHRDLISLSVKHGQQGTDWGISKPCEKCHWSSCSSIFFFFLSWLSPASKAEPRSLHHQPQTPGTGEITLYLLSHKVTVKVWWREHTAALVWCWRPRNISDASSQPAARTKLQF